jgi:hypothetical protein
MEHPQTNPPLLGKYIGDMLLGCGDWPGKPQLPRSESICGMWQLNTRAWPSVLNCRHRPRTTPKGKHALSKLRWRIDIGLRLDRHIAL